MLNVLYLFGGEKAQGAEIVIERLICKNGTHLNSHLILAPGAYAEQLMSTPTSYRIQTFKSLGKLNRQTAGKAKYLKEAISNFIRIPIYINRYIKANSIDVVHANTIGPSAYLILLVLYYKMTRKKVKWLWSDHDLRYLTNSEQLFADICVSIYDCTIAVSEAVAKKYAKKRRKVKVLHNGLDMNHFRPSFPLREKFRDKYNIPLDDLIVGIVAVIQEDKGQLDLIKAFKAAALTNPSIWLFLAGNFSDQNPHYVEEVKKEISSNSRIEYLGFMTDVKPFYNGCDILVNNSNNYRSESLGTSIYEAMACEKIVLGSNTGGTPEIISDSIDGFLFTAESVVSLQERLSYVFANFNEMDFMRKAARKKVHRKFNIEKMVQEYNTIIYEF